MSNRKLIFTFIAALSALLCMTGRASAYGHSSAIGINYPGVGLRFFLSGPVALEARAQYENKILTGGGSSVTWAAPASSGAYTVSVTISDSRGGSASSAVSVVVIANNAPAIASVYAPASLTAGSSATITCLASDIEGDTLSYS